MLYMVHILECVYVVCMGLSVSVYVWLCICQSVSECVAGSVYLSVYQMRWSQFLWHSYIFYCNGCSFMFLSYQMDDCWLNVLFWLWNFVWASAACAFVSIHEIVQFRSQAVQFGSLAMIPSTSHAFDGNNPGISFSTSANVTCFN